MSHYICKHCHQRYDECSCQPTLSDAGDGYPELPKHLDPMHLMLVEARLDGARQFRERALAILNDSTRRLEVLSDGRGSEMFSAMVERSQSIADAILSMPLVEE